MNKQMTGVGSPQRKSISPRPVFASIYLIDSSGKCNKKWLVQESRVSIGSHRDCSIQLLSEEVEAVHAVLSFGRHHILLKSFGDDVKVDGRLVREWLFDHACDIQVASHILRVVPQRESSKRPAETNSAVTDSEKDANPESPVQTNASETDLAAIKQLMESLILPLRQGLDDVKLQIGQTTPTEPTSADERIPADEQAPNRLLDEIDRRIRSILQEQDGHLAAAFTEFQNNLRVHEAERPNPTALPNLESIQTFAQKVEGGFAELRSELETIQRTQQQLLDSETINGRFAALEAHSQSVEQSLREIQSELASHSLKSVEQSEPIADISQQHDFLKLQNDLAELRNYSQQASSDLYDELIKLRKQIEAQSEVDSLARQNRTEHTAIPADLPPDEIVDHTSSYRDHAIPSQTYGQSHSQVVHHNHEFDEDVHGVSPEQNEFTESSNSHVSFAQDTKQPSTRNAVSARDIYARFNEDLTDTSEDTSASYDGYRAAPTYQTDTNEVVESETEYGKETFEAGVSSQEPESASIATYDTYSPEKGSLVEDTELSDQERLVDFRHGQNSYDDESEAITNESPDCEVDPYRSFREKVVDEALSDELEPNTALNGPGTMPVNSQNTIEAFRANEKTGAETLEEEDSIESYMEQLLRRVRGDTSIINPDKPIQPADEAKRKEANERHKALRETLHADTEKVPVLMPTAEQEPFRARQIAAEKLPDMSAMRELANTTTRSAINQSERKRMVSTIYSKLIVSIVGFLSMYFLYSLNGFQVNFALFGIVASLIVGCIWGWECIMEWVRLRKENNAQSD
jgi:hypothetical protein